MHAFAFIGSSISIIHLTFYHDFFEPEHERKIKSIERNGAEPDTVIDEPALIGDPPAI